MGCILSPKVHNVGVISKHTYTRHRDTFTETHAPDTYTDTDTDTDTQTDTDTDTDTDTHPYRLKEDHS